jgi:hypothetical protein
MNLQLYDFILAAKDTKLVTARLNSLPQKLKKLLSSFGQPVRPKSKRLEKGSGQVVLFTFYYKG